MWDRIGLGFKNTLTAAALAIVSSLVVGTLLAVLRIQLKSLTGAASPGSPRRWPTCCAG